MTPFAKEAEFEAAVIHELRQRGWGDAPVLKHPSEPDLLANWKRILFENNRGKDRWALLESGQSEATVTLQKPYQKDGTDYLCSGVAPQLRLVRHITPDGKVWVLATNFPMAEFPAQVFGDLFHQRWRIEESYKRLKHRFKLESCSRH